MAAAMIAHVSIDVSVPSPRSRWLTKPCESRARSATSAWRRPALSRVSRRPVPSRRATMRARARPTATVVPARRARLRLPTLVSAYPYAEHVYGEGLTTALWPINGLWHASGLGPAHRSCVAQRRAGRSPAPQGRESAPIAMLGIREAGWRPRNARQARTPRPDAKRRGGRGHHRAARDLRGRPQAAIRRPRGSDRPPTARPASGSRPTRPAWPPRNAPGRVRRAPHG